jgi:hypothetical protein
MSKKSVPESQEAKIQTILQALEGLQYGTLNIIVHDSQITQIERTEKKRFPLERAQSSGDGSFSGRNHKVK